MHEALTSLSLFILLYSVTGTNGQNPCPDPTEILPCICNHNPTEGTVNVDCSAAASSDEIYSAFNDATWPSQNLTTFSLQENLGVKELPRGVFGDNSFEKIHVSRTFVASIHSADLLSSKDRLWRVTIKESSIEEFPWEILPQLTNLKELYLYSNHLTSLPHLQSASLEYFSISKNNVVHVQAGWYLPNLRDLSLDFDLDPSGFQRTVPRVGGCQEAYFGDSKSSGCKESFRSSRSRAFYHASGDVYERKHNGRPRPVRMPKLVQKGKARTRRNP
ncbi:unnamed protein product [Darwinula stevensoni]|uniref:Uncharacterized protein n=1 Tax=Darwinula stevensoni TaxID=69355 RepID=A0A7R8XD17_9CRUS|nr:unnamed protein product [Darwinula stevensoni]CAG0893879.1 unnamed protein product [Darwinula stevensoni]